MMPMTMAGSDGTGYALSRPQPWLAQMRASDTGKIGASTRTSTVSSATTPRFEGQRAQRPTRRLRRGAHASHSIMTASTPRNAPNRTYGSLANAVSLMARFTYLLPLPRKGRTASRRPCGLRSAGDHRALGDQSRDLRGGKIVLAQHFARVLAIHRRRPPYPAGRRRELDWKSERLDRPSRQMVRFDDHLTGQRLRIAMHFADRQHWAGRDARRFEPGQPLGGRARPHALLDLADQGREIGHATGVGLEPRIAKQPGRIDHLHETFPVRLVRGADVDPAVARRERLIGGVQWVRRAQ